VLCCTVLLVGLFLEDGLKSQDLSDLILDHRQISDIQPFQPELRIDVLPVFEPKLHPTEHNVWKRVVTPPVTTAAERGDEWFCSLAASSNAPNFPKQSDFQGLPNHGTQLTGNGWSFQMSNQIESVTNLNNANVLSGLGLSTATADYTKIFNTHTGTAGKSTCQSAMCPFLVLSRLLNRLAMSIE
jgi:hypothetical protein